MLIPYEKYQRLLRSPKDDVVYNKASVKSELIGGQRDTSTPLRYEPYQRLLRPPGIPYRKKVKNEKPAKKWIEA